MAPTRLFVTGGTGVLGCALREAVAGDDGYVLVAPGHAELDLYDPRAVRAAVAGIDADAVLHLATRIPRPDAVGDPAAWHENDRLRAEASRVLADAALEAGVATYVQPTYSTPYKSPATCGVVRRSDPSYLCPIRSRV